MKQYIELLSTIKQKGTHKPAAREGMPSSLSYFGYQFRHDLSEGFPLLTTKKVYWKAIVVELLWFLKGDTNIKYLIKNGVNIWNQDAFNYYLKKCKEHNSEPKFSFESFVEHLKEEIADRHYPVGWSGDDYQLGDCGYQYGKVWRDWDRFSQHKYRYYDQSGNDDVVDEWRLDEDPYENIDQIKNVINSLRNTPESRRHIVTAIDPAHDTDLALYWCHALFQFNCRPLTTLTRLRYSEKHLGRGYSGVKSSDEWKKIADEDGVPKYYLDCQLYQRSADVFLGVPFNIASYALLIHIIAKMCNMVPGEFIHTFGDVHIYDNHMEAVNEQLTREPKALPELFLRGTKWEEYDLDFIVDFLGTPNSITLADYDPHPAIKADLSTGLKK